MNDYYLLRKYYIIYIYIYKYGINLFLVCHLFRDSKILYIYQSSSNFDKLVNYLDSGLIHSVFLVHQKFFSKANLRNFIKIPIYF